MSAELVCECLELAMVVAQAATTFEVRERRVERHGTLSGSVVSLKLSKRSVLQQH